MKGPPHVSATDLSGDAGFQKHMEFLLTQVEGKTPTSKLSLPSLGSHF